MSSFGTGSNSYGQFWYGSSLGFPGFIYKKNVGVCGRRTTKFAAGGNMTTNTHQYIYNKYKPGTGGVGATSISTRRAKNRYTTVCNADPNNKCGNFYMYLGQHTSYSGGAPNN